MCAPQRDHQALCRQRSSCQVHAALSRNDLREGDIEAYQHRQRQGIVQAAINDHVQRLSHALEDMARPAAHGACRAGTLQRPSELRDLDMTQRRLRGVIGLPGRSAVETIPRMPAHLVRSDALYSGAPYAYAAVAPPGALVFTAGACPIDQQGQVTAPGDYVKQAELAVANLKTALLAGGADFGDVVKTTVYVASAEQSDLVAVWNVVHAAFGEHDAPSTLLGVAALGYSGQLVEIEAVAAVPHAF
jgi:enamine deaminase RidA (YjgF/YER057c/UK114 family)